jgi:hypothetical protein
VTSSRIGVCYFDNANYSQYMDESTQGQIIAGSGEFRPRSQGLALTPAAVSVEEPAVFRDFAMSSHVTMAAVEGSGQSPAAAACPTQPAAKTTTKITKT